LKRPTIAELAQASGFSISTVERVISGRVSVRKETADKILQTADKISFLTLNRDDRLLSKKTNQYHLGFILLQSSRPFYQRLAKAIQNEAAKYTNAHVIVSVEYLDDLSPSNVAERIVNFGLEVDALGVVAAEHPLINKAIEKISSKEVPVFALITSLNTKCGVGYVGVDSWKVGRMAAWTIANICKTPGKIGLMNGSLRYRCQELNEIGFRSYFREHAPDFQILEPFSSQEIPDLAEELTRKRLKENTDLVGFYFAGGGITGAINALREFQNERRLVTIGYELMEETRAALLDNILTLVISLPLQNLASEAISAMIHAKDEKINTQPPLIQLPFDIHTSENL
jgi:LacI family transcriptional regulator